MKTVRCAIYTRKSSEEGLEQDFNSLDAQREACAAYILSQASEGWKLAGEQYDDGGLSGGSLQRPALQRLLEGVKLGKVDIIVVYKVDRLTRSLLDFAKLVEAFDAAGISFVSVTQSFNTTTSMGRLTLNMLLSFAQFEREVTAERIRDKIAASKARGMWMGGVPPLGYRPDGRSLAIVADHAALVRMIYDRYLALGCVRLLADELSTKGVRAPRRVTTNGKPFGGGILSRGQLYFLLKNPIYAGDIPHKGKVHPGNHAAIVNRDTWEQVQELLATNRQGRRSGARATSEALLARLIVDAAGETMATTHTAKNNVRYRYYVSRALHHKRASEGLRLPGREIEALVKETMAQLFADPWLLIARLGLEPSPALLRDMHNSCSELAVQLRSRSGGPLREMLDEVRAEHDRLEITVDCHVVTRLIGVTELESNERSIVLAAPYRLTRSGSTLRLVQSDGAQITPAPDSSLVRLITLARSWWARLADGSIDVTTLARDVGYTPSYVTRVLRLAFLSPRIVEAVLSGKQHSRLSASIARSSVELSAAWTDQEAMFLVC
jgi:DNA invertase Pin-like site-specific DNA recombinase